MNTNIEPQVKKRVPARAKKLLPSEPEFCDWVLNANFGESIVYYRGHLARDRIAGDGVTPETARRTNSVAMRAFDACDSGLVQLYSKKHALFDYEYLAVRINTWMRPDKVRDLLDTTLIANGRGGYTKSFASTKKE
jgi:hypothetical protein